MECGELSVMEGTGTPGMLLWHAGSCGTSTKVSTLNSYTQSTIVHEVLWYKWL